MKNWKIEKHEVLESTFDVAAGKPAWTAIVAQRQLGGRGRMGRHFVCEEGGLWLTAVLPAEPPFTRWEGFSLAAGLALVETLHGLGVSKSRLRWPNDALVGKRKLAGILVERPRAEILCVGIGINITNDPAATDPTLDGQVCNLADFIECSIEQCQKTLLAALDREHKKFLETGLLPVIAALDSQWVRCPVTLDLYDGSEVCGIFDGLNAHGNVRILDSSKLRIIPHLDIMRLQEV